MQVASFFAGAGGLDLGFRQAGFEIPWANEYDKAIHATYEVNHPQSVLERRSLTDFGPEAVPQGVTGMIGGPPCQSWSEAGMLRGAEDRRGQLFFRYVDFVDEIRPTFFLAENVSGILFTRHSNSFREILKRFCELGYNVSYGLLNANDYGVPQDRERVIIVGYRLSGDVFFSPPAKDKDLGESRKVLDDAIRDLDGTAAPAANKTYANENLLVPNHEFLDSTYSSMYMSRNRVRSWDEPSFTIQAGGRHAPLHPSAPKMEIVEKDKRAFVEGFTYRRLTVREAARVQTFPDDFIFHYRNVLDGYKMIGNAVPVEFARRLALQIRGDLSMNKPLDSSISRIGELRNFNELKISIESKTN
jgi:DNA (cytosine-5)-methyltransferase 1